MWFAARDPDSHDFAVKSGCNVMVTPLMKGDEEVADLKRKFDTAVADHPEAPRRRNLEVLPHVRRVVRQQVDARGRVPRPQPRILLTRSEHQVADLMLDELAPGLKAS